MAMQSKTSGAWRRQAGAVLAVLVLAGLVVTPVWGQTEDELTVQQLEQQLLRCRHDEQQLERQAEPLPEQLVLALELLGRPLPARLEAQQRRLQAQRLRCDRLEHQLQLVNAAAAAAPEGTATATSDAPFVPDFRGGRGAGS